jgi:hypothetical protein
MQSREDSLLLPGHGGSTLRAFALDAGHAAFVGFLFAAFRTQAAADFASCKWAAHATSTLSTLTLASAAFSRSTASFFFYFVFLLLYAVHFLATLPASTAAPRHGKSVVFQVAT